MPVCISSLVITAASVLGVTVEVALEAYGTFFVHYASQQVGLRVYEKLRRLRVHGRVRVYVKQRMNGVSGEGVWAG